MSSPPSPFEVWLKKYKTNQIRILILQQKLVRSDINSFKMFSALKNLTGSDTSSKVWSQRQKSKTKYK